VGRLLALVAALCAGLALAVVGAGAASRGALLSLLGPCVALGAAFLSLGVFVSTLTRRQIGAASAVVAIWFFLVVLYDLGLLGLLVLSDGALGKTAVAHLVIANPVGLFRLQMLAVFGATDALAGLGIAVPSPRSLTAILLWLGWIIVPLLFSGAVLSWRKSDR
jgi:Cu-processing system permease protein